MRLPATVSRLLALLLVLVAATAASGAERGRRSAEPKLLIPKAELFADELFAPSTEKIDPAGLFQIDDTMRAYLHDTVQAGTRLKGPRQALFDSLYQTGELKLDYDTAITRNAREAFAARSGNCLSLVILTAAMAKAMDVPVQYQSVFVPESWSRSEGLTFYDGHVNISLRPTTGNGRISNLGKSESGLMTIDFVAPEFLDGRRARVIGEQTIVAMYYNNRSAEAIAAGRLDDAYWLARESILQDPLFTSAYNTMAVVYRRKGEPRRAERLLAELLAGEPNNVVTLTNMVLIKRDLGEVAEAERLSALLKELQPYPPFFFFEQGVAAMKAGNYITAKEMFEKEVRRAGNYHEFHFWLALAYLRLGEPRLAQRQLTLALETSTTEASTQLYAGKLAHLRQQKREYREGSRGLGGGVE